jgi:hypothetical protein
MLAVASAPIDPHQQAVLFYLYTGSLDRGASARSVTA